MRKIIVGIVAISFLFACNNTKGTSKNSQEVISKAEILVGEWQMMAIRFKDGRVMMGDLMGNPYYEYTKGGIRVKTLRTTPAPPPDSTKYVVKGDSLFYPGTKYPAMKIEQVTMDTIILENDKLTWHLARADSE
jgi:hypothetical protein